MGAPIVVKADGLALGKGVFVCGTEEEAEDAVDEIMVKRAFGASGSRVLIEECLFGQMCIRDSHKNMSIEQQAQEVDRVKRSEHGVITDPFFLSPDHTIDDANRLMAHYRISGVPITVEGKLVGILTNRDLSFEDDYSQKIRDVMTKDRLVTAPEGTTLDQAREILRKHKVEKLPIVDDNYMLKGLITKKDSDKLLQYPNSAKDDKGRLLVAAAVGIAKDLSLIHI